MNLPPGFLRALRPASVAILMLASALPQAVLASDRFNPAVMNSTSQQRYAAVMAQFPYVYDLSMQTDFQDCFNGVKSPEDTRQFLQDAFDKCAGSLFRVFIPKGNYIVHGTGGFNIPDNVCIEWENGAVIYPQNASPGSWLTNVRKWDAGVGRKTKLRTNVTLINPQIDGGYIDYNASDYKGDNAMGFAGGYDQQADGTADPGNHFSTVSGVSIFGGHVRNFMANNVTGGPGGKGINFEEGVLHCKVDSLAISNCTYATFASPTTSDPNKVATDIVFAKIAVDHCGAMFYYIGDNGDPNATVAMAPPSGTDVSHVVFDGTGNNVGHYPDRIAENNHEKSAPIVISAGANVYVTASITNPPGFPMASGTNDTIGGGTRFPGSYPSNAINSPDKGRLGAGLSGPIGAVVWGWGVNCTAKVQYKGDCDDVIRIQRPRAAGIDKYPTFSDNTKPCGAFNFYVYVWASGTASTPLRYGQRALVGYIESTNDVGQQSAVLPATASLRDDEYVGIPMALYSSGTTTYVTKTVTDYQPYYPNGTGNKHDVFVESPWGIGEYPHMYFKLGSTHAAAGDQVSGLMWVCSGIPDSNGNLVGHLSLNATLTNDAQANIYPTYSNMAMCYPIP